MRQGLLSAAILAGLLSLPAPPHAAAAALRPPPAPPPGMIEPVYWYRHHYYPYHHRGRSTGTVIVITATGIITEAAAGVGSPRDSHGCGQGIVSS
jgi:hypothetical protein